MDVSVPSTQRPAYECNEYVECPAHRVVPRSMLLPHIFELFLQPLKLVVCVEFFCDFACKAIQGYTCAAAW